MLIVKTWSGAVVLLLELLDSAKKTPPSWAEVVLPRFTSLCIYNIQEYMNEYINIHVKIDIRASLLKCCIRGLMFFHNSCLLLSPLHWIVHKKVVNWQKKIVQNPPVRPLALIASHELFPTHIQLILLSRKADLWNIVNELAPQERKKKTYFWYVWFEKFFTPKGAFLDLWEARSDPSQ